MAKYDRSIDVTRSEGNLERLITRRTDRIAHLEREVAKLRWRNSDLRKRIARSEEQRERANAQLANLRASRLGRIQVWYWRKRRG